MTKPRYDDHSTEFGLWLRNQKPDKTPLGRNPDLISSTLGYVTTNLDFFWKNYKTGEFMLLEEKRYMAKPAYYQTKIFEQLRNAFKDDPKFKGLFLIQFESTNPEDGKIFINNKEITKEFLLEFLSFNFKIKGD